MSDDPKHPLSMLVGNLVPPQEKKSAEKIMEERAGKIAHLKNWLNTETRALDYGISWSAQGKIFELILGNQNDFDAIATRLTEAGIGYDVVDSRTYDKDIRRNSKVVTVSMLTVAVCAGVVNRSNIKEEEVFYR